MEKSGRTNLIYGLVIIGLGFWIVFSSPFDKIDGWLKGKPDDFLTMLLIVVAVFCLWVGAKGSSALKVAVLFWMVSP